VTNGDDVVKCNDGRRLDTSCWCYGRHRKPHGLAMQWHIIFLKIMIWHSRY